MTSGSTASSGTDGIDPTSSGDGEERPEARPADAVSPSGEGMASDAPAADEPGRPVAEASDSPSEYDADRRAFFFSFGKQAVSAVGQAAGMADVVSRTSSGVAASLLGLEEPSQRGEPSFTRSGDSAALVVGAAIPAAENSFRSAYRLAGDELIMLDQRGVPEALDEVAAKRGSDVAYYLRLGVARGGPVMAQVAAYGLAMTAAERASQPLTSRQVELKRTRNTLVEARPSARLIGWALSRLDAAASDQGDEASGEDVAAAMRTEADVIASTFQVSHAAITTALVNALPLPADRPLGVLLHGDLGALNGGLVGTGLAAVQRLRDAGREMRVFVTETRPFMDGARLASWELRQAGIDHKVIADAAVAWLFARERIDAVLIGAEWVAANGDVGAVTGSRAVAQLASVAATAEDGTRPQVHVVGVAATIDPDTADGTAIPTELRPARDLTAFLTGVPVRAADAIVPAADVIPAGIVHRLTTEVGSVESPDTASIAALLAGGGVTG